MLILFCTYPTIILYQLTKVYYSVVNTVYPYVISLCYDNSKSFLLSLSFPKYFRYLYMTLKSAPCADRRDSVSISKWENEARKLLHATFEMKTL